MRLEIIGFLCLAEAKVQSISKRSSKKIKTAAGDVSFKVLSETKGNAVISPICILGAMYLTAATTEKNSDSETQILKGLWGTGKGQPYTDYSTLKERLENAKQQDEYTLKDSSTSARLDSYSIILCSMRN